MDIGMDICILDAETTGLGSRDEVIQLSGIVTNSKFEMTSVFNEYCMSTRRIDPKAYEVHGIDHKTLEERSEGKFLEEKLFTLKSLEVFHRKNVLFMSYKTAFDLPAINNTLMNNGIPGLEFGNKITTFNPFTYSGRNHLCVLNFSVGVYGGGHSRKLTWVKERLEADPSMVDKVFDLIVKKWNIPYTTNSDHDGFYDAFLAYYIMSLNKFSVYGI